VITNRTRARCYEIGFERHDNTRGTARATTWAGAVRLLVLLAKNHRKITRVRSYPLQETTK
jgi:hypothetical protein